MKIAFISFNSSLGGSELLWTHTARAALADGDQVFMSLVKNSLRHSIYQEMVRAGARASHRRSWGSAKLTRMASRWRNPMGAMTRWKPDVIMFNQSSAFDFVTQYDIENLRRITCDYRIPYVVVCHSHQARSVPSDDIRDYSRTFFNHAAHVMFVSAANMQDMRRHLVHVLPNASVVKNPVNLTDISPVPWPAQDEPLCLASVGSLITIYKAQDLLMEVLSTESWRSRAWKLRLYGSGPDQNYLLALREHLGLQDRVELMGHVSDIRGLWAQNHLLVMPSFVEGTPISMVEAMLCARPVLVTDVAGCPEWVRDGVDGFVAPGPTRGSVSNTLERAWQSRADWKRMGAQAHERAVQLYDPQAGRTLLNLLRQTAKST